MHVAALGQDTAARDWRDPGVWALGIGWLVQGWPGSGVSASAGCAFAIDARQTAITIKTSRMVAVRLPGCAAATIPSTLTIGPRRSVRRDGDNWMNPSCEQWSHRDTRRHRIYAGGAFVVDGEGG